MNTATTQKLPKYIQRANQILETIAAQPAQTWRFTQRELGDLLNIAQPDLSSALKMLEDKRRIIRGAPLKTRGRNYELIAISTEPLSGGMRSDLAELSVRPKVAVRGVVDLQSISQEQITNAVKTMLIEAWENEAELNRLREEKKQLKSQYQRRVDDIRKEYERIEARERELVARVENLQNENSNMRGRLNSLILKTYSGEDGRTYSIAELLRANDRRELQALERIMRQRPNDYRGRDAEVA